MRRLAGTLSIATLGAPWHCLPLPGHRHLRVRCNAFWSFVELYSRVRQVTFFLAIPRSPVGALEGGRTRREPRGIPKRRSEEEGPMSKPAIAIAGQRGVVM